MRVLVTGGTGFVGQRMIRFLLESAKLDPQHIACLIQQPVDTLHADAVERLERSGVRMVSGDLDRAGVSDEPAPEFDLLVHIAARTSTSLPESALTVNDVGIHHLLDWVKGRSRGTRFVYTSTIGVMDRSGPCEGPLREDSPCNPRTPYSVTKLRGEQVVRERAARDGFSWTILRLPTVYGPGQMRGGLFDRLMEMAASQSIFGRLNWPGRTSVIHVDDVARIVWVLSQAPAAANALFCVASDESLSVSEIAQEVGRATGRPLQPIQLSPGVWSAVRKLAWNRPLLAVMSKLPNRIWLPFWRLGLIADDGFWYDTSRLREVYHDPIMTVSEGMRQMLEEGQGKRVKG